ncbi:type ISP restriction/modification enzyme [Bartonella koehlerae]|uniref:type ISP restriction/modification enzyme n=1 Tax=Bartonella koehlerae TaxID=92181 RepID=UPI001FD90F2E|nr:type ISP restriction/modification enzyme [Bartonella koehlerae]
MGVKKFLSVYPGEIITKEDIFYYVYSLLHSEDYHAYYGNNSFKKLPHIPCVRSTKNFRIFVYCWMRTLLFACVL